MKPDFQAWFDSILCQNFKINVKLFRIIFFNWISKSNYSHKLRYLHKIYISTVDVLMFPIFFVLRRCVFCVSKLITSFLMVGTSLCFCLKQCQVFCLRYIFSLNPSDNFFCISQVNLKKGRRANFLLNVFAPVGCILSWFVQISYFHSK